MSHGSAPGARQGFIHEVSNDKGISMIAKVVFDGKPTDVEIMGSMGIEGAPIKGCRVLAWRLDDGTLVGMAFPPPADRSDQKKPGEVILKNHKSGSTTKFADSGTIETTSKKDVTVTADGKIEAKAKGNHDILADGVVNLAAANGARVLTEAGPSNFVFAKV